MKIQTQARLLVIGILLAPLLIILINVVYIRFFTEENISDLPAYEDISYLLNENISARDWESITRFVSRRFRNYDEITVFSSDYFVLYSSISQFNPGEYASRENVFALFASETGGRRTENQLPNYNFMSRVTNNNIVYILNKTPPPGQRARPRPPPLPALFTLVFILIILLTVFAICMSIVIARTITRSVQILEGATRRIAEGELDLKIDVKGSNEITSLTNSLNKMRNALKEEELRRSRFIMGISHDLKTPLALIKGYAEAIEDGITEDTVSRRNAAEIIITKSDQLEGMINDLISYVRMETGEWREKLNNIDITLFLENLVKTLSMDVGLLHHEFITDINLPENLSVLMDEKLTQRALENLIHNAVRYTQAGSVIRFTAALIEKKIELTISDNGSGIEKEDLPHVFELFYRGTSSRREQGMGLGLAVVKWVADYHGWPVSAVSEKDRGISFTITIPLEKN
jgi:signal transduction histidine kinase